MKLVRGPLRERIDSSKDTVIRVFKQKFSQPPIAQSVSALLFYGSRLFGSNTSDYDLDLILTKFSPSDFKAIREAIEAARQETTAVIDFEVYYKDTINLDDQFTTGAQGCYFLYSWAYADAIMGSIEEFKKAVEALPPQALKEDLDRKVKNYFGRIQHALINDHNIDVRAIRKNLVRAIHHAHLLLGNWGYEDIYGFSTDSLLRREIRELSLCTAEMMAPLEQLLDGTISREAAYKLANQVHKQYREKVKQHKGIE